MWLTGNAPTELEPRTRRPSAPGLSTPSWISARPSRWSTSVTLPSIRLSGPPLREAPVATGQGVATAAGTGVVERRDAIQRSRFVAVVLIAVLNMLDLVTTYVAISRGAHEANPIVAWMIESRAVVFAKVLICGWLIVGVVVAKSRHRRR